MKEETRSFETRWALRNWVLILSAAMSEKEMKEAVAGLDNVKGGRTVSYEFVNPCWLHGQLFNRPGFADNSSVLTSRLSRIEMIDNTVYAITKSGSCYRLEDGIDGIGIPEGEDDISGEATTASGEVARYKL